MGKSSFNASKTGQNWSNGHLLTPYTNTIYSSDFRADTAIKIVRFDKRNNPDYEFTMKDLKRFLHRKSSTLYAIWSQVDKEKLSDNLETSSGFYHINPLSLKCLVSQQYHLYDCIAQYCNRTGGRYSFKLSKLRDKMQCAWITIVRQLKVLVDRHLIRILKSVKRGTTLIEMLPYSKEVENEVLTKLDRETEERRNLSEKALKEQQKQADNDAVKMLSECLTDENSVTTKIYKEISKKVIAPIKDTFFEDQSEEERNQVAEQLRRLSLGDYALV